MATKPEAPVEGPAEESVRILADKIEPVIRNAGSTAKRIPRTVTTATARALLAGVQPVQMAFLARALNAVASLTAELDQQVLGEAAGATSDYDVLVHALETPEALSILQKPDPLAAARLRGLLARSHLLEAEGGPLTVDKVAKILGISRQAVEKRRQAGRLLGLNIGKRGYLYPSWQFSHDGLLAGMQEVLSTMNVHDPWMQVSFFLNGSKYLGGETPLAELRRGELESVLRAAQAYGEQGAA